MVWIPPLSKFHSLSFQKLNLLVSFSFLSSIYALFPLWNFLSLLELWISFSLMCQLRLLINLLVL
jgi:hypothetical protein